MTHDLPSLLNTAAGNAPTAPPGLVEEGIQRGRAVRRRHRRTLAVAALAAGTTAAVIATVTVLTQDPVASGPASPVEEIATHDGQVCPDQLPRGNEPDHGFGTSLPADEAPTLPAPDSAWVCQYAPLHDGNEPGGDRRVAWVRMGPVSPVPPEQLPALTAALKDIEPATRDLACPDDLGPRWMLVIAHEGDMTGVVNDEFGCGDVRLTDDPFRTPPGDATQGGAVPGILYAPDGRLLDQLKSLAADTAVTPITTPRDWEMFPQGAINGELRIKAGCLLIRDAVAFWPAGTTWDGATKTLTHNGRLWATLGEHFSGGGGLYPHPAVLGPHLPPQDVRALERCLRDTGTSTTVFAYGEF